LVSVLHCHTLDSGVALARWSVSQPYDADGPKRRFVVTSIAAAPSQAAHHLLHRSTDMKTTWSSELDLFSDRTSTHEFDGNLSSSLWFSCLACSPLAKLCVSTVYTRQNSYCCCWGYSPLVAQAQIAWCATVRNCYALLACEVSQYNFRTQRLMAATSFEANGCGTDSNQFHPLLVRWTQLDCARYARYAPFCVQKLVWPLLPTSAQHKQPRCHWNASRDVHLPRCCTIVWCTRFWPGDREVGVILQPRSSQR